MSFRVNVIDAFLLMIQLGEVITSQNKVHDCLDSCFDDVHGHSFFSALSGRN